MNNLNTDTFKLVYMKGTKFYNTIYIVNDFKNYTYIMEYILSLKNDHIPLYTLGKR